VGGRDQEDQRSRPALGKRLRAEKLARPFNQQA
jgi:hypothetical protein